MLDFIALQRMHVQKKSLCIVYTTYVFLPCMQYCIQDLVLGFFFCIVVSKTLILLHRFVSRVRDCCHKIFLK
jgi:hypothetical protein